MTLISRPALPNRWPGCCLRRRRISRGRLRWTYAAECGPSHDAGQNLLGSREEPARYGIQTERSNCYAETSTDAAEHRSNWVRSLRVYEIKRIAADIRIHILPRVDP